MLRSGMDDFHPMPHEMGDAARFFEQVTAPLLDDKQTETYRGSRPFGAYMVLIQVLHTSSLARYKEPVGGVLVEATVVVNTSTIAPS